MSKYTIDATRGLYVADTIGDVVADMRGVYDTEKTDQPYYDYGHPLEINRQLSIKDKSPQNQSKKFPLIALRMDFPEPREGNRITVKLNLGIFYPTKEEWSTPKRYTETLKPVLYPLYDLFMKKLVDSGMFSWNGDLEMPKHVKYDRPFHGVAIAMGNEKFVFTEPLDAIEIQDLEVTIKIKC